VAWLPTGYPFVWAFFRDEREVDGDPVRAREHRLERRPFGLGPVVIETAYGHDDRLGFWLPREMRQTYGKPDSVALRFYPFRRESTCGVTPCPASARLRALILGAMR
jgi:hypothetical protein